MENKFRLTNEMFACTSNGLSKKDKRCCVCSIIFSVHTTNNLSNPRQPLIFFDSFQYLNSSVVRERLMKNGCSERQRRTLKVKTKFRPAGRPQPAKKARRSHYDYSPLSMHCSDPRARARSDATIIDQSISLSSADIIHHFRHWRVFYH